MNGVVVVVVVVVIVAAIVFKLPQNEGAGNPVPDDVQYPSSRNRPRATVLIIARSCGLRESRLSLLFPTDGQ